jgi:hypothetical protein
MNAGTNQFFWLNGNKLIRNFNTANSGTSDRRFNIGVINTGVTPQEPATNIIISDLAYWYRVVPTDAQVLSIYNGGNYRPLGIGGRFLRNFYSEVGQSGQKISMKTQLTRTNNQVNPFIYKAGLIKT